LIDYNKISNIDQFMKKNKSELEHLPIGNCYFANLVIAMLLRNIDPAILFGSFLGFSIDKMTDTWNILCNI